VLVEAVRVAGDIPNIRTIRQHHGSWVDLLAEAGVADDGRANVFGIQSRALDGHLFFSLGELVIDVWLTHHAVPHEREPLYPGTQMRGDFRVGDTIIEYFGLAGVPEYDVKSQQKRRLAREYGLDLLEITYEDVENWRDGGAARLAERLGI